ncbi:ribbon-helix-helix domain-containing protein [Thiocapsa sp. N5-Cardenillas]|uniref:ribbon-helix-helix domain-containing protein n=1 Tax=Thiocapsa sp. N5-Cardenillas TaxID=3137397 RepID=UPI0035B08080
MKPVVISAKIPQAMLDELNELQTSLHISTRQELIERALRLFIYSSRFSEKSIPSDLSQTE